MIYKKLIFKPYFQWKINFEHQLGKYVYALNFVLSTAADKFHSRLLLHYYKHLTRYVLDIIAYDTRESACEIYVSLFSLQVKLVLVAPLSILTSQANVNFLVQDMSHGFDIRQVDLEAKMPLLHAVAPVVLKFSPLHSVL